MQLNLRTDYALRMLMTLSHQEGLTSIDAMARAHGISRNHLAKVAQDLAAHGYIETVRGRGGGVRLAQAAEDINIGAVVRHMERRDRFLDCMQGEGECALAGYCGAAPVLSGALEAFFAHLDQFTLTQIGWGRARIRQVMGQV